MAKLDQRILNNCSKLQDFMDRTSVKKMAHEYHPQEIDLIERAVRRCMREHKTNTSSMNVDFNFIKHASRDVRDMHRAD